MSKHTPGPWEWDKDRPKKYDLTWLRNANGASVVEMYGSPDGRKPMPSIADRALIAASPDMYDALQDALAALKHGKQACDRCGWDALVKVHEDAIQHIAETLEKAGATVEFGSSQNGGGAKP